MTKKDYEILTTKAGKKQLKTTMIWLAIFGVVLGIQIIMNVINSHSINEIVFGIFPFTTSLSLLFGFQTYQETMNKAILGVEE